MPPQTIIFIGRSGCGKGTQSKLVMDYLGQTDPEKRNIFYAETGAQFREFINEKGYTNRLSSEVYERNDLQPDFLAIWVWSHLFIENLTGEEHLVIDGTPRSLPEAMVLDSALKFYGRRAKVVHLDVSREWSRKQLMSRGREDDSNLEKIEKKLDWFESSVIPAINYFKDHQDHEFIEVIGQNSIEKVHSEIIEGLKIS